jgi:hypothetical protein
MEIARRNSFVSLGARDEDGPSVDSIVDYIDDWKDDDGQLLTILGEYGSGKTTTCFHLAQKYAKAALHNPSGTRIPVLIELKHFSQSFSLRTFLTDFFTHQKGINMRSYSTFERLNRQGRFVLLFDGFDEMTNYADPAMVHKYLDDILSLQQGKAKVLLTCRTSFFKDRAELEHLRTASDLHTLLHKHKGYRVVYLSGLSDSQVQFYMSCYYGEGWAQFFHELQRRPELRSIANRPILLHMIVSTVHSAESLISVNTTELYERYTDIWIKRDNWRCHLTPSQRNDISKVLAWELFNQQVPRIYHIELKRHVVQYFGERLTVQEVEQYAHEVRTCTFLTNDLQGCYSFVHKSFAEFFVAKYMLDALVGGRLEVLGAQVSPETVGFLAGLISRDKKTYLPLVWDLLVQRDDEVNNVRVSEHVRALAAYVLCKCKESLSTLDLTGVVFPEGADFSGANLNEATLTRAQLNTTCLAGAEMRRVNLRGATLRNCSLAGANMENAVCEGTDFTGSDLSTTVLRGVNFTRARLGDVVLTPDDVLQVRRRDRETTAREFQDGLDELGPVMKFLTRDQDKTLRRKIEGQLKGIAQWTPDEHEDILVLDAKGLRESLIALQQTLDEVYRVRLDKLLKDRQTVGSGVPGASTGMRRSSASQADEEGDTRFQRKKHRLRQEAREARLKRDFLFRQVEDLLDGFAPRQPDASESKTAAERVKGALFADSIGLSRAQSDWLQRSGATVQVKKERESA